MKSIRFKIIIGYILIALLAFLAAWHLYNKVIRVLVTQDTNSNPVYEKSSLTSIAISSLYQVDYYGNRLTHSYSPSNLKDYRKSLKKLNQDIDTLSRVMVTPSQSASLKEIVTLIERKERNISELTALYKKQSSDNIFQESIDKVVGEVKEDTIIVAKKEKFFKRLFKKQVADTITRSNKNDLTTALEIVRSDVIKRQEEGSGNIQRKLQSIIKNEQEISGHISLLINELNREATENALAEIAVRRATLHDAGRTVVVVGLLAVVIIILFLTMIMMDINKSQRYKRELEAARRRAEDLMRSRQKLLFNISHDIKAPLSSITGYLDLIEQTQYVRSMKLSASHIMDLLTNLLEYARLEQGKVVVTNSDVEIDCLVENIRSIFLPLASEKGISLVVKSPETGVVIETDAVRLRQIIMNLLSNAVKFTSVGEITLFYEVRDDQLHLTVQDSGCGIEQDKLSYIFGEFSRVNENCEGSGLGLAVVSSTVELLGGVIGVESSVGQGSLFSVAIPVCRCVRRDDLFLSKSINVLIIDDDKIQLTMCEAMLRKIWHHPLVANSVDEVLDKLSKEHIDVILSDRQMGQFSGEQLVKAIRAEGYLTPVVAVSASEPDALSETVFCDFLKKPFTIDELQQMMGVKLDLRSLREMMGDDKEAIDEIVNLFIQSTIENREELSKYLLVKDYVSIKQLCHKMLPMFMQFNIVKVSDLLREIDRNSAEEIDPLKIAYIIYKLNCFSLL